MTFRALPALCLALAAVLANPRVLETYVILDGHIDNPGRVHAAQGLLALGALAAGLWSWRSARRRLGVRARLFAGVALALSCLVGHAFAEVALRLRPELALEGAALDEYRFRQRHDGETTGYVYDSFDPELGWVPTPGFAAGGVRTNSQGIRADREYAARPAAGARRVVFLGDSFTWGERTWHGEIANGETFAALVERELAGVETVNLGVHGFGTDQQLLYLRRLGLRLTPDLVVLGFFEFDYERNGVAFFSYAKPRFVLEGGELRLTNVPIPAPRELLARPFTLPLLRTGALLRKAANAVLDRTKLRPIEAREAWRVTEAILEAMKRDVESAGAKLLVVDIPPAMTGRQSAIERAAARWAARTRTEFLSLRAAFGALPPAEWDGLYDGHFTAAGHRATARAIAGYIAEHGLLAAE